MHLVIYIDLIFFVNVVMDFIVLFIMKELLRENTTLQRLSIASVIASLGSCIVIVIPMPAVIRFLFLYGIISTLVLKTGFSITGVRDYIIKLFAFFGVAFFVDGFLNFVYYRLQMEKYYRSLLSNTVFEKFSVIHLIAGIGGFILLYPFLAFAVNQVREHIMLLHRVQVMNQGKTVKGVGLLDTGNMLFDPVSGEPVVIAEFSWIREIFTLKQQMMLASYMKMNRVTQEGSQQTEESKETPMMIHMIPFHSVGEEEGLLVAVRLDSISIGDQSGLKRRENVLIGLYPGKLSGKKAYQVILHNSLVGTKNS